MNRQAVLIAASPPSDPIPGVYSDVASWYTFLRSYPGGVWNEEELVTLKDQSRENILTAIHSAKDADYSLVVFAGHGHTVKTELPWTETQLFLSDGDSLLERQLNAGTPRCTLVLDCCRRSPEQEEAAVLLKDAALLEGEQDPVKCRALYDQSLEGAESGLVKVYATEIGSAAADQPSFSQHMLFQANLWVKQNRGILTLEHAGELAIESIRRINPQQRPEYHGGRRLRHFPFAVGA